MDQRREQLLDILFDHCAADIERLANTGAPPRALSEEFIRNLVYTCAQEPDALDLFQRLVRDERAGMDRDRWGDGWGIV